MIALIDYEMGNLGSVSKALEKAGFDVRITDSPQTVRDAAGIVLPGVGAFVAAIENLRKRVLDTVILDEIAKGKPFLGICLGLQMLFESGDEGAGAQGLGLFKGKTVRFTHGLKVPHMGWNQLNFKNRGALGADIPEGAFFYFVHSYHVAPEDESIVMCTTNYGYDFVSAITRDNVTATQFHPEKSQKWGHKLLANFYRQVTKD